MEELPSKKRARNAVVFGELGESGKIEGTRAACAGSLDHMQIDHRCFDAGVSHEGLNGTDIRAGFGQVRGE
jgi:hypothetical protein